MAKKIGLIINPDNGRLYSLSAMAKKIGVAEKTIRSRLSSGDKDKKLWRPPYGNPGHNYSKTQALLDKIPSPTKFDRMFS
jgi:hypothetical protein